MIKTQARRVLRVCKALRSGKYAQGTGQLRCRDGKMCCLGVAQDVCKKAIGALWSKVQGGWELVAGKEKSKCCLVSAAQKWLGFASDCGPPILGYGNSIAANDNGKTFQQIAAAWERIARKALDAKPKKK
jgi:hypothetical protein